jgi:stress response protein SCP2
MSFNDTVQRMLIAAEKAAGIHWKDMSGYLETEFEQAKNDAAAIALEVANGTKKPEQAKIELEAIEESLRDVRLAATVDVKAAAQDAINAALEVLRAAVNQAAKVPIF